MKILPRKEGEILRYCEIFEYLRITFVSSSSADEYLAKEGEIHLCSVDFSSQFLATFTAHVTPVNCVTWNPFYHNLFLSCASEYRVLLWHRSVLKT